jgi:prepilin-type N-terminal cleavage/methylation domain-containing protein
MFGALSSNDDGHSVFRKGKTMMRRKGFTLVELVVVILILGILAGVAAPKMLNTSAKATDNGIKQTLAIVRDAIELYQANNGGALPPCNATGTDFIPLVQTYIRGAVFPKSPLAASAVAGQVKGTTGVTTPDGTTGWMYNSGTGEFIVNSSAMSASSAGPYSSF